MKTSVMSGKKTKSHVFPTRKRIASHGSMRARNRGMSMESLTARLASVPNKITAPSTSSYTGIETRAKITSPSQTVTRSLDTSHGEDKALITPAAGEDGESIFGVTSKPIPVDKTDLKHLITPDVKKSDLIHGALRLVLGGVSCDTNASDAYSTPPSELSAAADSISRSPTVLNEKEAAVQEHQASKPRCTRVGLPALSVTPIPGTALSLFGSSSVPVAFLPTYTNEIKVADVEPHGMPKFPAYARPSMSSWFQSPANSSVQGTIQGLPRLTRPRHSHRAQPRPFARNENVIIPRDMPKVPKEGPNPSIKRLPMYKAVVVSGFDKK